MEAQKRNITIKKVVFEGERNLASMNKKWLEISNSIIYSKTRISIMDKMTGHITVEEVSSLITELVFNRFNSFCKVAVVLTNPASYDHRFFDAVVKNYKFNIEHFGAEKEAIDWLSK